MKAAETSAPKRFPIEPVRRDYRPNEESSPSRYIKRVDRATGEEIPGPIAPHELLVHAHRDKSLVDVTAQILAGRFIELTGNEAATHRVLASINALGATLADRIGAMTGSHAVARRARALLGVTARDYVFSFREPTRLSDREVRERIEKLRIDAHARLSMRGDPPRLQVLLTGATGFLGKELLCQVARDKRVSKVVCVLRPEKVRDPATRQVIRTVSPERRGKLLLGRLGIAGASSRKFEFVGGDIEKPLLGLSEEDLARLSRRVTHVIHCAASVAFDAPYEESFRANVLGSLNALELSLRLQRAKGSPFIHHVAIETSYIHGRKKRFIAQEGALTFPRNYYNNYYELTKAMASFETDQYLVERGLRVVQLLPSIVIGRARSGLNHGDTKVVNAPVNAFGRAREAIAVDGKGWADRSRARMLSRMALNFPGNKRAELNLVPVDRVAAGILAALTRPDAIKERIHLATDNRITSRTMVRVVREEIGIDVRLVDPTLFRNLTLPVVKATLQALREPRIATALEKLGTIFGGYGEWGQPIHDVGNDVRILDLPLRRPDTEAAFRMLCRHNDLALQFGKVRDPDEVARRELLWQKAIEAIERESGREAASIPAGEFRRLLGKRLDLRAFKERRPD